MPKPRQPHKIKIDPLFLIPDGAEDIFVYSRDGVEQVDDFATADVNVEILGLGLDDSDEGSGELTDDSLGAPDNFSIISQTVRRAGGGQLVVDVVLGIEDVPGASDYDVQVIK